MSHRARRPASRGPARGAARVVARAAPALLALAATAGCAATPDYPVVGERATVEYPPELHGQRWVEVVVAPAGGETVTVTGGALFSPYFERLEAVAVGLPVAPGRAARVRLPLGIATCPAGGGPSSAQLVIEAAGVELLQSVTLDDAVLAGVNADECRVQDATQAAVPMLGASDGIDGDVLRTSVVLTRGEALLAVTLDGVQGSEFFSITAADGELPATLAAGRTRLEVPVDITVARCDPDALAGSESAFVFSVEMTVEGGDPSLVELDAPDALREELRALTGACSGASVAD